MGKPVEVALHVLIHLRLHLVLLIHAPARRLRPLLGELAGEDAEDQVHDKEGSKDHLGDEGCVELVLGVPKKSCEQNFEGYVERPEFWPGVAQTPLKTWMAQSGPKFWSPIIKAVKILLATSFLGHPVRKMFGRIKWIDQEDEREGGGYCREMVMADEAILPGEERPSRWIEISEKHHWTGIGLVRQQQKVRR